MLYLYVKKALNDAGLVPDHGELAAANAGRHLVASGFKNIATNTPLSSLDRVHAPVGSIIVYEGGQYGHIEVKASANEYISDYNSATDPFFTTPPGQNRRIIGIYVK